jgi:hypothetical protein
MKRINTIVHLIIVPSVPVLAVTALLVLSTLTGCKSDAVRTAIAQTDAKEQMAKDAAAAKADSNAGTQKAKDSGPHDWKPLFDGKTLGNWKKTNYGGEGAVTVKDGALVLEMGNDITGVHWADDKPYHKMNYEIELEAQRADGDDFFCGLTFPVAKSYASLICGGWGGTVVGISSLDGFDASENESALYVDFKKKQWYHIRLRVTENKLEVWINKKLEIEVDTTGRKVSVRPEVELSRPLGFCTWRTTGVLRNIRVRKLSDKDLAAYKKE